MVAVEHASVLLPPAYLVRIAGYKLAWENIPGGEYLKLRDGYGEPVSVQEDDDLLFLERIPCGEWVMICTALLNGKLA